ncbi:hypothetical protein Q9233_014486 [Columba guinea]|nr:hypothetical protein Q9233_014486 [Columba guinea]
MHRPPEGVEGAQVTRLPSFKALLKELRGRNAATPLHAGSLERLLEGQAKADAEQQSPPVVPSGSQDESGQLAEAETRSRRRWLPWHFLWPGTAAAAEALGPSGSAHSGVLFGRPLEAICSHDGALPQPIQDLLALLHEQGPSTEGIFRLAASERASRDIREALDTGAQVHLASQPVHVLAVILKDFLRKIPSKLLHSELYQQWMDALQKTSRQERLAGLREPPEGVEGAQVTRLPSFKALLKELRGRNAATPLHAGSLERLLEGQAKADAEQQSPPVVPSGSQDESGQLAEAETRSRRRWLPWHFLWPGTAAAAEALGPSGSAHSGVLFGRPLEAICSHDGALPQPIQDLLALLHEQGPSTEGIFRLAASERASRDIREALDTGAQVHLASQPVHVLAVILKDFLRKIPSKLLHSELYQQWMDALQKTSRQERLAGLRESIQGKMKFQEIPTSSHFITGQEVETMRYRFMTEIASGFLELLYI